MNFFAATSPSREELLAVSRTLFPWKGFKAWVQRKRPRIAPFHVLLPMVPTGSTVLDVGCGSGLFLGLLAALGKIERSIGFDANGSAISNAKRMQETLPPERAQRMTFLHLAVQEPWPEGSFDVVSILDVVHHIPPEHQRSALRMAYEKVRPGGILLYKDMARRPRVFAAANRLHDLVMVREWIHYLPLSEAIECFTQAGASIEHVGSCRMLWYQHEYVVARKPGST